MDNLAPILVLILLEFMIISRNGCSGTISCFECSSRNGSNTACEDPFNAGFNSYIERCKVPRGGHIGEFPAHFCVKLIGTSYTTSEKLVVRRCVMETMDTQCGKFRFEDDLLRGCILTCNLDGCNSSNVAQPSLLVLLICTITSVLLVSTSVPHSSYCSSVNAKSISEQKNCTTNEQYQVQDPQQKILHNKFNKQNIISVYSISHKNYD